MHCAMVLGCLLADRLTHGAFFGQPGYGLCAYNSAFSCESISTVAQGFIKAPSACRQLANLSCFRVIVNLIDAQAA